jgi:hypothetical protein
MRKLLYIVYVPLLLMEEFIDMIGKMWNAFHETIKTITLATEKLLNPNEPTIKKPDI